MKLENIKKTILEMALDNLEQIQKLKQGGAVSEVLMAEIGAFKRVCVRLGFDKEAKELQTMINKLEKSA